MSQDPFSGVDELVLRKRREDELEARLQPLRADSLDRAAWLHAVQHSEYSLRNPPTTEITTVYSYADGVRKIVEKGKPDVWQRKRKIKNTDIRMCENFRIRFSLSEELRLPPQKVGTPSNVREKCRVSFYANDQSYRLDFTIVNDTIYEFEVEFYKPDSTEILNLMILSFYPMFENSLSPYVNSGYVKYETGVVAKTVNRMGKPSLPDPSKPHSLNARAIISMVGYTYAVTNKLDGMRAFLVFLPRGAFIVNWTDAYMLNVPTSQDLNGTIFDGEFDPKTFTFHIFDTLFINGKSVMDDSFHDRWLSATNWYADNATKSIASIVKMKLYWCTGNIYEDFQNAIAYTEKTYSPEDNDGYIFTPMDKDYRDNVSYKWKPIELLTIDFSIKVLREATDRDGKPGFMVELMSSAERRKLVPFTETFLYSGEVDQIGNDVAEMAYNFDTKSFAPIRIRTDKIFPNNIRVAESNMTLIKNPLHLNDVLEIMEGHDYIENYDWTPQPFFNENFYYKREAKFGPCEVDTKKIMINIKKRVFELAGNPKGFILVTQTPDIDKRTIPSDARVQIISPETSFSPVETDVAIIFGNTNEFNTRKLFKQLEGVEKITGFFIDTKQLVENLRIDGTIVVNSKMSIELRNDNKAVVVLDGKDVKTFEPTEELSWNLLSRYDLDYNYKPISSNIPEFTDCYKFYTGTLRSVDENPVYIDEEDEMKLLFMDSVSPIPYKSPEKKSASPETMEIARKLQIEEIKQKEKSFKKTEKKRIENVVKQEEKGDCMRLDLYRENYNDGDRDFCYKTLPAIGDGACFFHAIISLLSPEYRKLETKQKKRNYVYQVRADMVATFTYEDWLEMGDGAMSKINLSQFLEKKGEDKLANDISSFPGILTDENLDFIVTAAQINGQIKKKLRDFHARYLKYISEPCTWVGEEVFIRTGEFLNINIFILDTTNKYIYRTCYFNPEFRRCVVLGNDGGHYEPVVADKGDWRILTFSPEDRFIRWIRENCRDKDMM
jgi:hypothetical protein